jgi:hypothetical protein
MAFPSSPVNLQQATVNNIIYVYDSAKSAWTKLSTVGNTVVANSYIITGNAQATSTVTGAVQITGGASINTGNLYIGGSGGNAIVASGNIYSQVIWIDDGIRWTGNGNVFASGVGGAFTANTAPPISGNVPGDHWYNVTSDILYEYIADGVDTYWVDIQSLGQIGNIVTIASSTLQGNIVPGLNRVYSIGNTTGYLRNVYSSNVFANTVTLSNVIAANSNVIISSNLIPGANVTYNLGSSKNRFKDLYLSGSTIYLGGATLGTDGANLTITNPQGGSFSVTGSVSGAADSSFGNITAAGNITTANLSVGGNVTITGSARRILGDFSNSTIADRVLFQSSSTNSQTRVGVIPNGTSTTGIIEAFNSSDTTNASIFSLASIAAEARLSAGIAGTGTYQPITFYTSGSERIRIDTDGGVGIGRTAEATYQLDIANPSTASGADTFVRVKSLATDGDGDAELILDAGGSGEATVRFYENGVSRGYIASFGATDYLIISNQIAGGDLIFLGAETAANDTYSLRYRRDSGEAPVTGITGTITSSATISTITGLSTTTGLYVGMVLTKTAGTGELGTQACIQSIDSATQITVTNGFAAMTAGSITFTATPNPVTITAFSESAGTWAVDQDFARFAFGSADSSGAGDGGIKASINAYVYDTAGTGAGLDFYISSNGTTLEKGIRLDQNANLQFNSGYGSVATAYGCRAWVNFDGTGALSTNQTIRASGGVTSVAKGGTAGYYTVNLSFTMPDINYAVAVSCNPNGYGGAYGGSGATAAGTNTATAVRIEVRDNANAAQNSNWIMVSVFR